MNLVDRVNRQRSLPAISRTRRSGRIAANASVPTTTYSYDANGNLLQAGGWNYMWDYLNRMLASGYANSTTTYAYDPSGARVLQTSTTSTTYYPNKYYSFTSTKIGANTYATSTNYIWNGDTLLATIDQKLYNGAATGSPIARYIHPDHLGSTNAVTDQNGALVQLLDYYPYGATRVSTSSYPTNEKRQYIDQFSDAQTGLNYLNARYYDAARGQFLSEDPVFWGDPKQQNLTNPQSLGTYSYSADNPIVNKDPSGRCGPVCIGIALFTPTPVGDPVFGSNGQISSTPQQMGIYIAGFTGQAFSGSGEATVFKGAKPAFTSNLIETVGATNPINEVTSLPSRIPKGAAGIIAATAAGAYWAVSGVDGWSDSPTQLDLMNTVYNTAVGNRSNGTSGASKVYSSSRLPGTSISAWTQTSNRSTPSAFSGMIGLPTFVASAANKGYGSSGTTYTSFAAPNAFSACGTLCK